MTWVEPLERVFMFDLTFFGICIRLSVDILEQFQLSSIIFFFAAVYGATDTVSQASLQFNFY
jgi:hypothetical protein